MDSEIRVWHPVSMPEEERLIIFTYAEAYLAIRRLCSQKQQHLPPPGAITAMAFLPDNRILVTFQDINHAPAMPIKTDYDCDFMTDALIAYTLNCSIPLPRRGVKAVEMTGEKIMLRISIPMTIWNGIED